MEWWDTLPETAEGKGEGNIEEEGTPRAHTRQATGRITVASSVAPKEELQESPKVGGTKENTGHAV